MKRSDAATMLVVTVALVTGGVPQASASFPGLNGRLAFGVCHRNAPQIARPWGCPAETIVTINPDGTGRTALTQYGRDRGYPTWSPDGSKLAFVANDHRLGPARLMTMNADGTDRQLIAEAKYFFQPAWSPDGTQIAVSRWLLRASQQRIVIVDVDGSGSAVSGGTGNDWEPDWSPDGSTIAFIAYIGGPTRLATMAPDGAGLDLITGRHLLASSPSWSPDGERIAFIAHRWGQPSDVYIADPDGHNRVLVTNTPDDIEKSAVWSPDGTQIAFLRAPVDDENELDIWTIQIDESNAVRVTDTPGVKERRLSWQPI